LKNKKDWRNDCIEQAKKFSKERFQKNFACLSKGMRYNSSMRSPVLEVSGLSKQYGEFAAVNNISFSIKEGEIVGLLGPNGAGKTTTIQMLLALTHPTKGSINYFGMDLGNHREEILGRINYVSAYREMQSRVTVWENLQVFAGLYEVEHWEKKAKNIESF
jgi:ABC-2 type transport system ATP-binding protein